MSCLSNPFTTIYFPLSNWHVPVMTLFFSEFHVTVFKRDTLKVVFVGHVEGNLYVVDFSKESTHLKTCLMSKADVGWLWNHRLAHVGIRNLQSIIKGYHVVGLSD